VIKTSEGQVIEEILEPPGCCTYAICRPCRKLYYPKPGKKTTCMKVFCPWYLSAREEAQRFKMKMSVITHGETES
jgi:hypothetical protein